MNNSLTYKEGYLAMICFLEKIFHQTKSEDIGSLLGDLQLLEDGCSMDPSSWKDWEDCIDSIKY